MTITIAAARAAGTLAAALRIYRDGVEDSHFGRGDGARLERTVAEALQLLDEGLDSV